MKLNLRYSSPAPDSAEGWENYSMPIGCSHFGGNVFGGVEKERIQITENSLENPWHFGGLNNFAEIYLHFPHTFDEVGGYERGLTLGDGMAYVKYNIGGVDVERTYFMTYPDRALVGRITSTGKISYEAELEVPFVNDHPERAKTGEIIIDGNLITMRGNMKFWNINFEGQLRVFSDGTVTEKCGRLAIDGATDTYFIFTGATNYELRPEVFLIEDDKKKLRDFDPHPIVCGIMEKACAYTYDELKSRHLADFSEIFGRVELELGETEVPSLMTDELLKEYSEGKHSRYLEVLYFQYGRYLLLSSSREGCLPATLQGVWNCHDESPWGSGYWHNINVQMNYWPAFIGNLAETFPAYRDFNLAFRPVAEKYAAEYIKEYIPENYTDEPGECGWTIGTASYAYLTTAPGGHSGPGTGGLTSKLFWEYYDFTGDKTVLREYVYPTLLSMAKHLMRCVRNYDGLYLSAFSASPEQIISNSDNDWVPGKVQYHHTVGCAFDQQMIWENANDLLKCVDILGEDTLPEKDRRAIADVRAQLDKYDPVQVGWSGQIKEYREEKFYGEIGEYRHRHISQLVGLYPGTSISSDTPAWLDAAKISLDYRSDESTGWALAHRLNAWARTGDGNRAYKLYTNLLGLRTLPNLWDTHPPFQIDGNLGGSSGVAEMLLQSHEKYISPLPCIPDDWDEGSYSGLCARGGFVFDVKWSGGCATEMKIHSGNGGVCKLKYHGIAGANIGFPYKKIDENRIEFDTAAGEDYLITAIPAWEKSEYPTSVKATRELKITWDYDAPVNVWRATDSSPTYDLIGINIHGGEYIDRSLDFSKVETVTYKITRSDTFDASSGGAWVTLNHSTALERDRYRAWIRQLNMVCEYRAQAEEYLGE
ncbi:MAG: glycoside hydrolase family 95 protein [Ruminococcaceae bacterium]|nr:glycoside hydrolase family 95 protein [Oscillospiraceae bacterium]